ncbi:hypothetical protein M514_12626 [Trichuris suis]|uniref:Uncharacterized protein n=1 Tax=Trichuris suis TaxID=68888 RepID=A0A085N3B4_9BILA|nr:hypothetical protein M513_12626 [Trichuris suis]KFD63960.1 hypothetical protein M514_12626 [Trichuris suis]
MWLACYNYDLRFQMLNDDEIVQPISKVQKEPLKKVSQEDKVEYARRLHGKTFQPLKVALGWFERHKGW